MKENNLKAKSDQEESDRRWQPVGANRKMLVCLVGENCL